MIVVKACIKWDRDVKAWAQGGVDFKKLLLPRSLILACLYMLHVQNVHPDKRPDSLRNPLVAISEFRWWTMTKFGYWVLCACKCGGEWNFGGQRRIRRRRRAQHCKALSAAQMCSLTRLKRYLERVADLNKPDHAAFFNLPRHKPTLHSSSSHLCRE